MSRFASPKSEEARMAALTDDDTIAGLDYEDPASMERLRKHIGNEMGDDLGDDMSQAIDSTDDGGLDTDTSDGY
jgi:hypothetical protein